MLAHRRRPGAAAGSSKRGRCLTTLLALRLPGADPGTALPRLCLQQWFEAWLGQPEIRRSIVKVWP
eukprot:4232111-Pyramimonas_sp.AAC.1